MTAANKRQTEGSDVASERLPHGELVDLHAHLVTDDYREAALRAGHERPDGMPGWPS